MRIQTLSAVSFTLVSMLLSLNVYADDMDSDMDEVTIRFVEEGEHDLGMALTLPTTASERAVERATMREGKGLSKANAMRLRNSMRSHDQDDDMNMDDMDASSGDREMVDGLAKAMETANEHAQEALQNAMDAREARMEAREEHHENAAGGKGKGQGQANRPE